MNAFDSNILISNLINFGINHLEQNNPNVNWNEMQNLENKECFIFKIRERAKNDQIKSLI